MLNGFIGLINQLNTKLAKLCALLIWLLMLIMAGIVAMRYIFNHGSVAAQEILIYLHAFVFLMGAGYTLNAESHVRVDVFYRRLSTKQKAYINLLGTLIFLMPFAVAIGYYAWDYVSIAWEKREASSEAGGLAFLYLLKSLLVLFPILMALTAVAYALTAYRTIQQATTLSGPNQTQ